MLCDLSIQNTEVNKVIFAELKMKLKKHEESQMMIDFLSILDSRADIWCDSFVSNKDIPLVYLLPWHISVMKLSKDLRTGLLLKLFLSDQL